MNRHERYDVEGVGKPFGPKGAGQVGIVEFAGLKLARVEEQEWFIEELIPDSLLVEAKDPDALMQYVKDRLTLALAKELATRLEWRIMPSGVASAQSFQAKFKFVVPREYIEEDE